MDIKCGNPKCGKVFELKNTNFGVNKDYKVKCIHCKNYNYLNLSLSKKRIREKKQKILNKNRKELIKIELSFVILKLD